MNCLVYDADCGFCTATATWLAKRGTVKIIPWQELADLRSFGLTIELVTERAYWLASDGRMAGGSQAIGLALIARGGAAALAGRMVTVWPVRPIAERAYGWVARNRYRMPGGSQACQLPQLAPPTAVAQLQQPTSI